MKLARRVLGSVLLVGAVFSADASAQVRSMDALVSLRSVDQPLTDIVKFLRDRSGANIVVIPTEGGTVPDVSLELTEVPWRDALSLAAEKAGFVVEEQSAGILEVRYPKRVEFTFPDADIREVIDAIGKVAAANIVVGPEVEGTISVRFNGVPWREALDVVAKTRGYTVVEEGHNVLRVVDPATLVTQMTTRSYQLRYLRPRGNYVPKITSEFVSGQSAPPVGKSTEHFSVLPALAKALNAEGDLDYIEDHNVVIVRDTVQVHDQISDILSRLDVQPQQVFVDVKFVTTSNGDVLNLGIDYGDSGPSATLTGGQIPVSFPFGEGSAGWEDSFFPGGDGPNILGPGIDPLINGGGVTFVPDTIFGALSFTQVQASLRLLQRDTSSEVIQAPKIIALDGKEATIFVGETIRYAEARSEQGQAGGLQLSIEEAEGSPVEVGFQLLIRPQVVPGTDRILMDIIPKETSLSGTGNTALAPPGFDVFTIGAAGLEGSIALPRTRSSTIVTTMMLDSGQTAVIGGLTTETETIIETRVPFISRVPILGELFKYEDSARERRSLIVFLTPAIVQSRDDTERLLQKELGRRRADLADELEALVAPVVDADDGGGFGDF